jgi:hypothetical protein
LYFLGLHCIWPEEDNRNFIRRLLLCRKTIVRGRVSQSSRLIILQKLAWAKINDDKISLTGKRAVPIAIHARLGSYRANLMNFNRNWRAAAD